MGPWWIRAGGGDEHAGPAPVSELGDAVAELASSQGTSERAPIVLMAADLVQATGAMEQLQAAAGQVLNISVLLPAPVAREAEAELASLRRALDNVPAPIFSKDLSGVYRACNRAFEEYAGLSRDEIIGATVYDVEPPELARVHDAAERALLEEATSQMYEAQVRYADGTLRDTAFFKAVYRDETGEVAGLSGVMLDVTDRHRAEAQEAAETDALTGLPNRRTFISRAGREIERSASSPAHPAFLLLDLDHFQQVNDRWGHAIGDDALCMVAECLQSALRSDDALARIDGAQFAVMLPGTSPETAVKIAERIRQNVAELRVEGKPMLRLTLSVGVAGWVPAQTAEDVLGAADGALYEAKRTGRNRVVVATAASGPISGAPQSPPPGPPQPAESG